MPTPPFQSSGVLVTLLLMAPGFKYQPSPTQEASISVVIPAWYERLTGNPSTLIKGNTYVKSPLVRFTISVASTGSNPAASGAFGPWA